MLTLCKQGVVVHEIPRNVSDASHRAAAPTVCPTMSGMVPVCQDPPINPSGTPLPDILRSRQQPRTAQSAGGGILCPGRSCALIVVAAQKPRPSWLPQAGTATNCSAAGLVLSFWGAVFTLGLLLAFSAWLYSVADFLFRGSVDQGCRAGCPAVCPDHRVSHADQRPGAGRPGHAPSRRSSPSSSCLPTRLSTMPPVQGVHRRLSDAGLSRFWPTSVRLMGRGLVTLPSSPGHLEGDGAAAGDEGSTSRRGMDSTSNRIPKRSPSAIERGPSRIPTPDDRAFMRSGTRWRSVGL